MKILVPALFTLAAIACGGSPSTALEPSPNALPSPLEAAAQAAEESSACDRVKPFYWEVGDGTQTLASGSVGGARYAAGTQLAIASATKWVFAAYVIERFAGTLDGSIRDALRMLSGYTDFRTFACRNATTLADCLDQSMTRYEPSLVGLFAYDNGHFQHWSVENGLGDLSNTTLAAELADYLGTEFPLSFHSPTPAGGMRTTPKAYANFLRRVIRGELLMGEYLGKDAVCASRTKCRSAASSPVAEDVHYSYGHWVEDDPDYGDGAFSSAGLFGFYPWISADKQSYGLVAREELGLTAYWDSLLCGREIRSAFRKLGSE